MSKKYTAILEIPSLDSLSEDEIIRIFYIYKERGIVTSGDYADSVWHTCDEYANYSFDFEIPDFACFGDRFHLSEETFVTWVKMYLISQLGFLSLGTLQSVLFQIKKVVANPTERCLESLMHANLVKDFFSLLPTDDREEELIRLLDLLDRAVDQMYDNTVSGRRTLASFDSYFLFHDILGQFWSDSTDISERLFYFPVWLWWNITAVIPIRPREFVLTPRHCLDEHDGHYFLTIRKNKIKGSGKTKSYRITSDYETKKYQIPARLASEILWYLKETERYEDNDIHTLFLADTHYTKWGHCKPYNSRYFTYINLSTCLRYFFEQIVYDRYGYSIIFDRENTPRLKSNEIQYLNLGDTRHLSLINMLMEGTTPMVAMTLAGHDNPQMSAHYYSNIISLIQCQTYRTYKKQIKGKQSYSLSKFEKHQHGKEYIPLDHGGRCYSTSVKNGDYHDCSQVSGPAGEVGFCQLCPYFRPSGTAFTDSYELYENQIKNECEILNQIIHKVRRGKGEQEEITQALLRIKSTAYSYKQYILETMEDTYAETEIHRD
ncbi:MAG: hypothetical protein Q4B15_06200 [Lachnospiraceae bacterium]|nr:hypothetical protein [Lachnospiraceae bacterium]